MGTIAKKQVAAGDILLYHGDTMLAKLIRFMDGTEVNHASICVGGGKVGEALGGGLTERTIDKSVKEADYVIVRRLKMDPGTMQPVTDKAGYYLAIGNRYGFEQILLLAFLGLTRKLHVNSYLSWLMRKVLDQAAEWLMKHGNRQPMICSEFVYRCYDEALPASHDPYSLEIALFPGTRTSLVTGVRPDPSPAQGRSIHRDSLLAWADDVVINRSTTATNLIRRSLEEGTLKQPVRKLTTEEKRMAAMPLDDLIKNYLDEAQRPQARALELGSSLRGPEMLESINRFSAAFYAATVSPMPNAKVARFAKRDDTQVAAALAHLTATVADFVTPGDLYNCHDLFQVGRVV